MVSLFPNVVLFAKFHCDAVKIVGLISFQKPPTAQAFFKFSVIFPRTLKSDKLLSG